MKSKLVILTGAILLALVLTTVMFAYSYNSMTASFAVTAGGGNIASSENATAQPDWNEIVPINMFDSEFLIPDGTGDLTQVTSQYPTGGEHWGKVTSEDDFTTYVFTDATNQYQTDLYQVNDNDGGEGVITNVTVYFRFSGENTYRIYTGYARAAIKTDGQVYYGTIEEQYDRVFATRSYSWTKNPSSGVDWTWAEIDALQAGVALRAQQPQGRTYCTFVYVRVDYQLPPKVEGDVPTGDLFTITPHPLYTGDLTVDVYITNVEALIKVYKYLNMKLYVANSIEAPGYEILSLENGAANFNIEGGTADNYTIQLIGGSYKLISGYVSDWGDGYEVVPELYCDVSQR